MGKMPDRHAQLNFAAIVVTLVGLLQIAAFLFNMPDLTRFSIATAAAPLPIVFTIDQGIEPLSLQYSYVISTKAGETIEIPLTPHTMAKISGPLRATSPYVIVTLWGPVVTDPLREVLAFGFCKHGKLSQDFEIETPVERVTVTAAPINNKGTIKHSFEVVCQK